MNPERVRERIEELFALAPDPRGGATRLAYSPEEARAMRLVAGWLEEAGLRARLDRFGNLWGLPATAGWFVTSGSHVDTVPNGGRLDGALGTVLAVEAAGELGGRFGVLVCAGEEAPRFGAGTLGSRQLAGRLGEAELARMRDAGGISALAAREEFLGLLPEIPRLEEPDPLSLVAAHLEVHVEQRRGLREEGASVGIVTAVAGPARYRLRFTGESGHSGEARMRERRDALCAAAEVILLAESLARKAAATVATVATVAAEPGSITAVPGRVELGLDVRGADLGEREELVRLLLERGREICARRGVGFTHRCLSRSEPVALDERVVELAEEVARREGVPARRCVSYAGHDAQHLAGRLPTALLFAASSNGVSHAPGEEMEKGDLENACRMAAALLQAMEREYGGER